MRNERLRENDRGGRVVKNEIMRKSHDEKGRKS
jgi:hypothetical protein